LAVRGAAIKSSVRAAAEKLGLSVTTVREQVGDPKTRGNLSRRFGLAVDWSKFKAPASAEDAESKFDPVDQRRYKDEISELRLALRTSQRRAIEAENLRAGVLGLSKLPRIPVRFSAPDRKSAGNETVVLFLSDLHWGESVSLEAMDGLNSYSVDIARARLGRWTHSVCDLVTKHWPGAPPDRVILVLGGDLISGAIHYELAKTDELKPLPAVRDLAEHLRHAITTLHATVKRPIDIVSLPGNHGRSTIKPESKESSTTSYDMLVSDFLELSLRGLPGISFYVPVSPDALFSIYGWNVLFTHGDRIGSRGGSGFIGPAATAARGFKRMMADYSARGVHVDLIVIGHFHTALQLEEGFVNNSLMGPSEWSRDGRYRPHPATQLFFTMHPRRRITQVRWIEVGDKAEGSLYEPPPPDRLLRPRFRVRAVTKKV
jgi:hypothetical protein